MPLSRSALEILPNGMGRHIGLALPIDPAHACLAIWLVENGYAVSALADGASPDSVDLITAMAAAGVNMSTYESDFIARDLSILLESDGSLFLKLHSPVQGAIFSSADMAECCPQITVPILQIACSPLIELAVAYHGVGQSCVSGFLDITNLQIAGSEVLVLGYAAVGQGVAKYASSYGARVTVCETDPTLSVKARLDGHRVSDLEEALPQAKVVFASSDHDYQLEMSQIEELPSGAFLCAATEKSETYPLTELRATAPGRLVRDHVTQHTLAPDSHINLVCNGTAIHRATGLGLPLKYADILIAAQLRAIAALLSLDCDLVPGLQPLPKSIERGLSRALLEQP